VLGLGAATRIYVATGATDMRLGFNGLYALAAGQLRQDPQSGHLFLFANKRRDRMKILFFDGSSLWVCARRMEQGRLHWPASEDGRAQLTREEFVLLIGDIDVALTTIDDAVLRVGELSIPIVKLMKLHLLAGGYIQADEMHVGVQTPEKIGKNHRAYFWQYSAPGKGVVFDFEMTRGKQVAKEFFKAMAVFSTPMDTSPMKKISAHEI
jgi:transposase